MAKEESPQDLLEQISTALESQKVDSYMRFQFDERRKQKDFDPTISKVGFLARVRSEDVDLPNVMSKIGIIFGVFTPYSTLPEIINNEGVISLQASH